MNQDEMTMPRCDIIKLQEEIKEYQSALNLVLDLFLAKCPEYESWVKMNLYSLWRVWAQRQGRNYLGERN